MPPAGFPLTYGDCLDRNAARTPEKIAVVDFKNRLTYRELNELTDRFAAALNMPPIRRPASFKPTKVHWAPVTPVTSF